MKTVAVAVLLLSLMPLGGCGRGTAVFEVRITGQLVDAETGEAVEGAWVMALSRASDIDDPTTIWSSRQMKDEHLRSATTPESAWSPSPYDCGWTSADGTFDILVRLYTDGDPPRSRSGARALLIEVDGGNRQGVDIEADSGEWSRSSGAAEPWATWNVGRLEAR